MRLIDADAFDNVLKDAQTECKKNGGNFRFGVLNNVRANLAKAPTIGGWISVQDRQPKKDVKVLAYWRNEITIADYCNGDWFDWIGDDETRDITYWMPLPEPPKVGDDE